MKTRLNVLKKEAEQICLWGEAIYNEGNYLMICDDGQMVFDIYGGSDDTKLSYENEYKDYEWRLTDIKDLQQGDVCKVLDTICVFDEPHPYMTSNNLIGTFWKIQNNRPFSFNGSINSKPVLKLFKKSDKK